MVTKVEIFNRAIGLVGGSRIIHPDDENCRAQICNDMYEIARNTTLEARQWTFAVKRHKLSPDTKSPEFGFGYRYKLPSGVITVVQADELPNFSRRTYWEREGEYILTDASTIFIRAVSIPQISSFSDSFTNALSYKLASDICTTLTDDKALAGQLIAMWGAMLDQAGAIDGMQGKRQNVIAGRLVGARSSGVNWGDSSRG